MLMLSLDASSQAATAALLTDGAVLCEYTQNQPKTQSVKLLPMIEQMLADCALSLSDVDVFACGVGPGSFTGVRIGVATARGFAKTLDKPCVAVDALECMAAGAGEFNGIICPIQDARAGQVYGAAFAAGGACPDRLMEDLPLKLEEYVETIQTFGDRFLFLGDGMPVHRAKLEKLLGDAAVFAQPQLAFLRPASAAYLASLAEETVDYLALEPLYLRAPNAALNKKLTEGIRDGK